MRGKYINEPCHYKWICVHCLKHGKGMGSCGINGHKSVWLHMTKLPSPYASKKEWLAVDINLRGENKETYLNTVNKLK
jgi:hypothetical protein